MYDVNGRAVQDEPDEGFPVAVFAAVAAALLIALVGYLAFGDDGKTGSADNASPTYALYLDCNNAALMHMYGLPTKADVMNWHYHGQWGYYRDGTLHAFPDLPGDKSVWDELYDIDQNPAFDK